MKFQTKKLVLSALFMALTCVATMSIRIPPPEQAVISTPETLLLFCPERFSDLYGAFSSPELALVLPTY